MGVGVETPFPVLVVVVIGFVEVDGGVSPIMDTQAYVLAHKPEQSDFAAGFQDINCANVIPFLLLILAHVSPD
tara:strand:- start:73 stop:291 length:219 start_codon:yes stop_codon:yes gene_type:complete